MVVAKPFLAQRDKAVALAELAVLHARVAGVEHEPLHTARLDLDAAVTDRRRLVVVRVGQARRAVAAAAGCRAAVVDLGHGQRGPIFFHYQAGSELARLAGGDVRAALVVERAGPAVRGQPSRAAAPADVGRGVLGGVKQLVPEEALVLGGCPRPRGSPGVAPLVAAARRVVRADALALRVGPLRARAAEARPAFGALQVVAPACRADGHLLGSFFGRRRRRQLGCGEAPALLQLLDGEPCRD